VPSANPSNSGQRVVGVDVSIGHLLFVCDIILISSSDHCSTNENDNLYVCSTVAATQLNRHVDYYDPGDGNWIQATWTASVTAYVVSAQDISCETR
jgi:hypothetical protein